MKRKVLKIGQSSLAISLPSTWVKRHNLQPSQEITVLDGDVLKISAENYAERLQTQELCIDGWSSFILSRHLTMLYRGGCDEVRLSFKDSNIYHDQSRKKGEHKDVQEFITRFIGAEVVSRGKHHLTVHFFAPLDMDVLEKIGLRIQHLFREMTTELLESSDDFKEYDKEVSNYHDTVTKFINYYLRLLNKSPLPQEKKQAEYALYLFIDKLVDKVRHISHKLAKYGCTKKVEQALTQIFDLFHLFMRAKNKKEYSPDLIARRYELIKKLQQEPYTSQEWQVLAEANMFLESLTIFYEASIA